MEMAKVFYSSFPLLFGYALKKEINGDLRYCLPQSSSANHTFPDAYFKVPSNGWPVSSGNEQIVVFETQSQSHVRRLHSTARNHGRTLEGDAGFRPSYGAHSYLGYLRDSKGNKVTFSKQSRRNRSGEYLMAKKNVANS